MEYILKHLMKFIDFVSSNDDDMILYKKIPRITWLLKGIRTYVYDVEKYTNYVIWDYSSFLKTKIKDKNYKIIIF